MWVCLVFVLELTELTPDPSTGRVSAESIGKALKDNTVLVSVMLANNETGVIQVRHSKISCQLRVELSV